MPGLAPASSRQCLFSGEQCRLDVSQSQLLQDTAGKLAHGVARNSMEPRSNWLQMPSWRRTSFHSSHCLPSCFFCFPSQIFPPFLQGLAQFLQPLVRNFSQTHVEKTLPLRGTAVPANPLATPLSNGTSLGSSPSTPEPFLSCAIPKVLLSCVWIG